MKKYFLGCLFLIVSMSAMEERPSKQDLQEKGSGTFEMDTAYKIGQSVVTELLALGNDPDRILETQEHIRELFIKPNQSDASMTLQGESSSYLERFGKLQSQKSSNIRQEIIKKLEQNKDEYAAKVACEILELNLIKSLISGLYYQIHGVHSRFEQQGEKSSSDYLLGAEVLQTFATISQNDTNKKDEGVQKRKRSALPKIYHGKKRKVGNGIAHVPEENKEDISVRIAQKYELDLQKIYYDNPDCQLFCPIQGCSNISKKGSYPPERVLAIHIGHKHHELAQEVVGSKLKTTEFIQCLINNKAKNETEKIN